MRNYLKKLFYIFPTYIVSILLCILWLWLFRYLFDVQFNIFEFRKRTWEYYFPIVSSFMVMFIIRKRFRILGQNNSSFFFTLFSALFLILSLQSQMYFTSLYEKTEKVKNISEISSDKWVRNIEVENYFIDDTYLNSIIETKVIERRRSSKLVATFYYIVGLQKDSLVINNDDVPIVWLADSFREEMSYSLSDEKKRKVINDFSEKINLEIKNKEFYDGNIFHKVVSSEERDIYLELIQKVLDDVDTENIIILKPSLNFEKNKSDNLLILMLKTLGIGLFILLIALIFPKYRSPKYKYNSDFENLASEILKIKNKVWVTLVLVGINILVYIILGIKGVDFLYPRTKDLIAYGAIIDRAGNGEYWRFITAMFLHGGVYHIFMNMVVLMVAGMFLEKNIGWRKMLLLYIFSGVLSGITSLYWHNGNIILVGASGAIFGVIGAILLGLLRNFKENKIEILFILGYVGVNILFSFVSNSDMIAHISGLIYGILLSFIIQKVTK